MKKYKPDKHGLITIRILTAIVSVILIIVSEIYVVSDFLLFTVIISIITIAIFVMFIYFPLYFSSLTYETTSTEVIKHSGVVMRSHQAIRYDSIQYTTVISTPLSQYTGFNFMIFFIYGGQLRLNFLSRQDTVEILKSARIKGMGEV